MSVLGRPKAAISTSYVLKRWVLCWHRGCG